MSKQLTIRGVPDEFERRLTSLSEARGQSLNATLLAILATAVGVEARRRRLERYVAWSEAESAEFDAALAAQRTRVDRLAVLGPG